MMTKKDFQSLADSIKNSNIDFRTKEQFTKTVLIPFLKTQNSNFKVEKFLNASGIY